jgi:hypothetical protein
MKSWHFYYKLTNLDMPKDITVYQYKGVAEIEIRDRGKVYNVCPEMTITRSKGAIVYSDSDSDSTLDNKEYE